MNNLTWSPKEKQVARTVFESAALAEEAELLERFKIEATSLKNMEDLRVLQCAIRDADSEYQQKYDYRYSQLIFVFARLVREHRISLEALHGLGEEKLNRIKGIASL